MRQYASREEVAAQVRDILHEMFGEQAGDAAFDAPGPWHYMINAKLIDQIDFRFYIQEHFGVRDFANAFNASSIDQIISYIWLIREQPSAG